MSFALTHLIGFGVAAATSSPVDISYTDQTSKTGAGTTETFSARDIGAAASDRKVVVGIWGIRVGAYTVSSVTVGGVGATQVVTASPTGVRRVDLWVADVPTGTTADVVVTVSGTTNAIGIVLWRMTGAAASAHATGSDTDGSDPQTANINVPANGAACGLLLINGSASTTWSGITEEGDLAGTAADGNSASWASLEFAAAQTPLAISADPSASASVSVLACASWGPA